MKKDLIFAPILIVIGVLLFLLRLTGIYAHIAISAVGVVALIAYIKTKQKINKDIVELNNNTNQLDRTDIYRLSFNSGRIHIFANFTWNINQEDHILGTKCTLKSFKK